MAKRKTPYKGVARRYQWKMYPTPEQDATLRTHSDMCIELWNALLEMTERRYAAVGQRETRYYYDKKGRLQQTWAGKFLGFHCSKCAELSSSGKIKLCEDHKQPTEFDMHSWITNMREGCPEWEVLSVKTPRRVATSLTLAYSAFYRRAREGKGNQAGYPRFKSKHRSLAIPHMCASGCKVSKSDRHEKSWWVYLKGVTDNIWARGQLPAPVHEWTDADVVFKDGNWFISVATDIEKRRVSIEPRKPITVKFGLIDGFCLVNNELITLEGLILAQELSYDCDRMKTEFDLRWPHTKRYNDDEWKDRCEERAEISRLESRVKRLRRNTLHVWSKQLTEQASILTIIKPPIKEYTKTPRGNEKEWGAAVESVSDLNRNTLSYAPAMAVEMLKYKAEELGVQVQIIEDEVSELSVGSELITVRKTLRDLRRKIKRTESGDGISPDKL